MDAKKQKLLIIVGPTASGKTSLSISLAQKYNGEIISADSRQVYRKLDIGTGKATAEEMNGISHYVLDVVDINTIYTAADFQKDATQAIKIITERNHIPIIAGGTFFYIDTLLGKISTVAVKPNLALRKKLEEMETTSLYEELKKQDPKRAAKIESQNRRRLIRALEITEAIGNVPPTKQTPIPYDVLTIGIMTTKETLRTRFHTRLEAWMHAGFEKEVRELLAEGIARGRLYEMGFEYQLMLSYLDGDIKKTELYERFVQKNWQYAKRQMTWLRRDESIQWFEKDDSKIFEVVEGFLNEQDL